MTWLSIATPLLAFLGAVVGAAIARSTVLRQIRYTKVQEKRAEVVPELYAKFLDIQFSLNMSLHVEDGLVSDEMLTLEQEVPSHFAPNPLTRGIAVEQKIKEVNHYFFLNRLWLGESVDEKAQAVFARLQGSPHYFLRLVRTASNDTNREEHLAEMRNWINSEIPTALQALETESRKALGTKKDRDN